MQPVKGNAFAPETGLRDVRADEFFEQRLVHPKVGRGVPKPNDAGLGHATDSNGLRIPSAPVFATWV